LEKTLETVLEDGMVLRGTPDCVVYFDDGIEIIDFKSGYQDVDPECYQLILYSALVFLNMTVADPKKLKLTLTVIQNKIIKQKVINKVFDKLGKIVHWKPEKDNYKAGSWCQFCSFKPKCRTYLNGINPLLNLLPDPKTLTDPVLASYYDMRAVINNYFESVKKELLSRIEKGNAPTHRVVEKKKLKYKFENDAIFISRLIEYGISSETILDTKLRSPNNLIAFAESYGEQKLIDLVNEYIEVEVIKTIKPVDEAETNLLPPLNDSTEGV
jgi:hypothetical protein